MGLTQVSTDGVKNDAITKTKIPANQIEASELADNAVDETAIANGAVTINKLATNAVDNSKIGPQAVTLSRIINGTSSEDGKFLRANNGASPSFESVNTDLVADTSPQLGGDLDTNSHHILLDDAHAVKFGDSNELTIEHAANGHSYIVENGSGDLNIHATNIKLKDISGNSKLETTSSGAAVTGRLDAILTGSPAAHIGGSVYYIKIGQDSTNSSPKIDAIGTSVAIPFELNGVEKARISANGGITFNGDTAADNGLDDYEEGTFTPSVNYSGGTQNNASGTFIGYYTKIGNTVMFQIRLTFTNRGSGSGQLVAGNLPFTPNVSGFSHPMATFFHVNDVNIGDNNHSVFVQLQTNAYHFYHSGLSSNDNYSDFGTNDFGNSAYLGCFGHYRAS